MNLEELTEKFRVKFENADEWVNNFFLKNLGEEIESFEPPSFKIVTRREQFRFSVEKYKEMGLLGLAYFFTGAWYSQSKNEVSIRPRVLKYYDENAERIVVHEIAHCKHYQHGASDLPNNNKVLDNFLTGIIKEGWASWLETQRYPRLKDVKSRKFEPIRINSKFPTIFNVTGTMGLNMYRIGYAFVNNLYKNHGLDGVKKVIYEPEKLYSELLDELEKELMVEERMIDGKNLCEIEMKEVDIRYIMNPKRNVALVQHGRKINNYLFDKAKNWN